MIDVFLCVLSVCVILITNSLMRSIAASTEAIELIVNRNTFNDVPSMGDEYEMLQADSMDDIYTIVEDVVNERMNEDDTSSWNLPDDWDRNGDN